MRFADKLSFLMHITNTSNKELAAELSLDRSMISLMRTGKRSLPKNPALVKTMALFFAKRCSAEFQRRALAEMLEQSAISTRMPTDVLADCLEGWLQGDSDLVTTIVKSVHAIPDPPPAASDLRSTPVPDSRSIFLYGEEGRREAVRRITQEIRNLESPCTVLALVDDNLEWLLSDYLLTQQLQSDLMELMERGFTFQQITPPMNYVNRFSESLRFWLPLYATGQVTAHYYPRLRDNLFRHSIIVVPGRCAQYVSSVSQSRCDLTLFTTDPDLVDAFARQFQEILAQCRPAMTAYPNPIDAVPCFLDFFSRPGDVIQMVDPLPITSAPRALLERCIREAEHPGWARTFQMYLDGIPQFEASLRERPYLDMSRLASPREVRAGTVYISTPYKTYPQQPCYTPETYALHLENILRLMEQYENYHFLPLRDKEEPNYNLFASEGGVALLVRNSPPFSMLEMRRPELVAACREHLFRKAEAIGYGGIRREKVRMELRALIRELQE